MKGNSYFRMKTSSPTLELDSSGPGSLAALMGRFRNDGQNEDYCLRAKPETAGHSGSNMLGSKYCDYEQGNNGNYFNNSMRNYQTVNKENVWNNPISQNDNRFKQLTPSRRQQPQQQGFNNQRQRSYSKSPTPNSSSNYNNYNDNSANKFVFKAKQNKTLGNLIQMAENYQMQNQNQQQHYQPQNKIGVSPNKLFGTKKYSNNQESSYSKKSSIDHNRLSIQIQPTELEIQIQCLKESLADIALQGLPKQALESSINIQIQDFLNRLIPSRTPKDHKDFNCELFKKQSKTHLNPNPVPSNNPTLLTSQSQSQGIPINFSFDVSYHQQMKRLTTDGQSQQKMQTSKQSEYLICQNVTITSCEGNLLGSKTQELLKQL